MSPEERDEFLARQQVCRMATIGANGRPHTSALWFVWDGSVVWINSVVKSQRFTDVARDGRVSIIVDGGDSFADLRGVTIEGTAKAVGEVPRTGENNDALNAPELAFARKYMQRDEFVYDGGHAWLHVTPGKIVSWDFSKHGTG
ncbi:MAG: pyridoxamine 5'-phosphate oxidase family protein [Acidimicrobiales bacterium]|nr:pyridoxamine 5'-phosphate oxidase family protein [Acidimicrobiales bacterium]